MIFEKFIKLPDNTRVKFEFKGKKYDGIVVIVHGKHYVCQDVANGESISNKMGYKYSWVTTSESSYTELCDGNMEVQSKTLRTLEIGDVLEDEDGDFAIVTDLYSNQVVMSAKHSDIEEAKEELERDIKNDNEFCYSIRYLELNNYKVVETKEEVEELTMEEVCKKLGKTIKIKK